MTEGKIRGYLITRKLGHDGSNPHLGEDAERAPVYVRLSAAFIDGAKRAEEVLRFLDRYRRLNHRSLIKLRDYWIEGGETGYLATVTELAEGGSLRDQFRQVGSAAGAELIPLFTPLAEATDFLHRQGIRHGDITPSNALLAGDGPRLDVPRLPSCDEWGVSFSPKYAAPEVWRGRAGLRSDQYSLAACYAELRLGRPLLPGGPATVLALMNAHLVGEPDLGPLPGGERVVLRRALAKDPGERYPTCAAFVEQLGRAVR